MGQVGFSLFFYTIEGNFSLCILSYGEKGISIEFGRNFLQKYLPVFKDHVDCKKKQLLHFKYLSALLYIPPKCYCDVHCIIYEKYMVIECYIGVL